MDQSTPPKEGNRHPRAVSRRETSIVVEDRAEAAGFGEQRIAAVAEQVQVERLVRLYLAVAVDLDGDCLRRLAGANVRVPALAT